tara:strand:- start:417 stop:668 length:252 start_codon:yes stop_codon:yes gene_type:complete
MKQEEEIFNKLEIGDLVEIDPVVVAMSNNSHIFGEGHGLIIGKDSVRGEAIYEVLLFSGRIARVHTGMLANSGCGLFAERMLE